MGLQIGKTQNIMSAYSFQGGSTEKPLSAIVLDKDGEFMYLSINGTIITDDKNTASDFCSFLCNYMADMKKEVTDAKIALNKVDSALVAEPVTDSQVVIPEIVSEGGV
jgi:hypothetical protein